MNGIKFWHIILLTITLLSTSCRMNNGDIGPLYGEWALVSFTIDGTEADIDCNSFYFRFQNNIILISEDVGYNEYEVYYGTWELSDRILVLNYTHHNSRPESSEWLTFNPPPALNLPGRSIIDMHVVKLNTGSMILEYINEEGAHQTYIFVKVN